MDVFAAVLLSILDDMIVTHLLYHVRLHLQQTFNGALLEAMKT